MGTVGDCFDSHGRKLCNLGVRLLAQHHFRTHEEARTAVFEWIEGFSNRQRRHSALGYVAPAVYEQLVVRKTLGPHEVNRPRNQGYGHRSPSILYPNHDQAPLYRRRV